MDQGKVVMELDRISMVASIEKRPDMPDKPRFPFAEGSRKSPALIWERCKDKAPADPAGRRRVRPEWQMVLNRAVTKDTKFLDCCYLAIRGNYMRIDINNALNRYPNMSRKRIQRGVMEELHQFGILRPGSTSSFYRVIAKVFTISEVEIRMDFPKHLVDWKAAQKLADCQVGDTLYFTTPEAQTKLKMYPYLGFMRMEFVYGNGKNSVEQSCRLTSLAGSSRQIIERLNPWRTLAHGNHRAVRALLAPVMARPTVTMAEMELAPGVIESLYRLSRKKNQHGDKYKLL